MISPVFEEIKAVWVVGLKVQPWWLRWKRTHLPFYRGVWRAFNNWCIPNLCSARISLEELNPSASKHPGLLPCVAIRVFPCTHSKITTPAAPSFSYGAGTPWLRFPKAGRCPRSTCRHRQLAAMGMMEEMGPVPELRPYRSSHPRPAEWLRPSQLKRNLKGARPPRAAPLSLITFSSVTVINTRYLRRVY